MSILSRFRTAWLLSILLASKTGADTYWIDPSCPAKEGWDSAMIEDAIEIAKITLRRHNMRADDPNQARAFQFLWKKPQSDVVASDIVEGRSVSTTSRSFF